MTHAIGPIVEPGGGGMYFDQKFDIVLTQRVDYHGDGPDRVMALKISKRPPAFCQTSITLGTINTRVSGITTRTTSARGTALMSLTRWALPLPPISLLALQLREPESDFLQIMPGTDDSPYITLCARLELHDRLFVASSLLTARIRRTAGSRRRPRPASSGKA